MKLFFDTETTGIPRNYKAPISDVDNWPRLVQLGFVVVSEKDQEVFVEREYIIKPDGFEIPAEASRVHGIATQKAVEEGSPIKQAFDNFFFWVDACDTIIGHNISFDTNVVGAEYWRMYKKDPFESRKCVCTMMSSIDFCKLPGKYGNYKYPKLHELYMALFGREMGAAHTALQDIQNTVQCYFALVERGIIK